MNSKYQKILITFSILIISIMACKKNELRLTEYDLPKDKAYVRFALLSPNTTSVMIKVNGVKINGASTSGSFGFYPSFLNQPDYSAIVPNGTVRLSLPNAGTSNDSVLLFTGALSMTAGKYYAVCLADTGINRTIFSIEDKLGALPDSGFFNLRLVNAMAKSQSISLIRIDSTSASVVKRDTLMQNIVLKNASAYIKMPISPTNSFLRFRMLITSTGENIGNIITPPDPALLNKRVVTIYASGFANGTSTLSPFLSPFIYNQ